MKRVILYALLITVGISSSQAQSISINNNGTAPDNSAMLDVSSTTSGFLIPRMTAAQRLGIGTPANGLMVFQTDGTIGFYIYLSGIASWTRMTTESNLDLPAVLALGNNATGDSIFDLGALAIGTSSASEKLHIQGNQSNILFTGATPHSLMSHGDLVLDIDVNANGAGDELIVRADSTTDLLTLTDAGDMNLLGDITFNELTNHSISITDRTTANANGLSLTLNAANGGSGGLGVSGGSVILQAGDAYNSGGAGNGGHIQLIAGGNTLASADEGDIILYSRTGTVSSERMRLQGSSGNLGIGTNNPGDRLEAFNAGNVRVRSNSSTTGFSGFVANNSLREYFMGVQGAGDPVAGEFHIFDNTSGSQRLVINATGDIGIGTSAPEGLLSIDGAGHVGVPGIFLDGFAATEGDIAVDDGEALQIGEWNGAAFTENMRVTAAGRIGIGETSPAVKLHITATDNSGDIELEDTTPFLFLNSTASSNAGFQFHDNGVNELDFFYSTSAETLTLNHINSTGTDLTLNNSGFFGIQNTIPTVRWQVDGGSDASLSGGGYIMTNAATTSNIIIDDNEIMARNNGAESPLYMQNDGGDFWIHNAQAGGTQFVVEDDGDVGIGTTTINANLAIGSAAGGITEGINLNDNAGADWYIYQNASAEFVLRDDGADRVRITTAGHLSPGTDNTYDLGTAALRWDDVYATNGTIQTSDIRLKKNITQLNYGLAETMQLRPVSYQWKNNDKQKIGLVAQEVLEIIPEIVNIGDDENKMLGLNYSELTAVLIKAIQEQQQMIESMQKEIRELKGAMYK